MYHVSIITSVTNEFFEEWQALWKSSPYANFHNSPMWYLACREGLDQKDSFILFVRDDDSLAAVFPLIKEKRFGISAICNIGQIYTDKSCLLFHKKDPLLLNSIIAKLSTMGNLYLEEFSEDITNEIISIDSRLVKQKASDNYYLSLEPDPFAQMSSKNRNKIKKRIREYHEHLSLSHYEGDEKGLATVFAVDKKSTKAQQGKASFATEKNRNFLRSLFQFSKQHLMIDVLSYDGVPFIYGVGFIYKNTYHASITAFDGAYIFLSPGKILHDYLFSELRKKHIEVFDFSRGVTALKKDFTPLFYTQYDLLFSKNRLTIQWWRVCDSLYYFVLHHKILYRFYLSAKNFLH